MNSLWLSALACFALTVIFSRVLIRYAQELRLVVEPSGHRQHAHATPVVGGIAMGMAMAILVFVNFPQYLPLFSVLGVLFLVGIADDITHLPSWLRLLLQAAAVCLMIEVTGAKLVSLGMLFSDSPVLLDSWAYPFTVFAGIGVINAINMSDGMDGLLGLLVLVICVCLLVLGSQELVLIVLLMAATLGFLFWNARLFRSNAALFMGDAGSTSVGLLFTYLLVQASQGDSAVMKPVTALWVLALPLIDAVALLVIRPIIGRSPFAADNLHYHHLLRRFGLGVNKTLVVAILLQLVLLIFGVMMARNEVAESVQLGLFMLVFVAYFIFLVSRSKRLA